MGGPWGQCPEHGKAKPQEEEGLWWDAVSPGGRATLGKHAHPLHAAVTAGGEHGLSARQPRLVSLSLAD